MVWITKGGPFKPETASKKKKRIRYQERDAQSRRTLENLKAGTYQPPPIPPDPNTPWPSSSTVQDFGFSGDHEDINFGGEGVGDGPLASSLVDSAWDSIPWDVAAPTANFNLTSGLFLDPDISSAIREHDRNILHHSRADNWKQCMNKLFSSYLWLKDKTENWTAMCSFESFTARFCKCNNDSPRIKQMIDTVDITGN
jgi:hypothetical protein